MHYNVLYPGETFTLEKPCNIERMYKTISTFLETQFSIKEYIPPYGIILYFNIKSVNLV